MKHTLLIALLGATVTLATPSLSFADNNYKFKNGDLDHNHQQKYKHKKNKQQVKENRRQHKNDKKRFVAKPPKSHRTNKQVRKDRHNNRQIVKNKQRHNKHNDSNPTFSITWNTGGPIFTYGNETRNHGYNKSYKKNYKNRGKRIYKRLNNQANRIQHGVQNGQLVNREVRSLRHEQRNIKQTMSHYNRDGHINKYESSELNQLLDVASKNIHRKSNNRRTRYVQNHNNYNNNHFVQY